MKKLKFTIMIATVAFVIGLVACDPERTGVVIHKEGCCDGYTLYAPPKGDAILIDMGGEIIHEWSIGGSPPKMLSGGSLIGASEARDGHEETIDLVQEDWDGNIVWRFTNWDDDGTGTMMARQHHDFQRQGNPVGYYAPGQEFIDNGNTLVLAHYNEIVPEISNKELEDAVIYEVTWSGNLTGFEWHASDHFRGMGFDESAKAAIYQNPGYIPGAVINDWIHINSISLLGENHWYDEGDKRFNPENIILCSRHANFIAIISRQTGEIVWRVGPDFSPGTLEGQKLGQIIGQHHAHMIPKGLPGAGNILVFDNGGVGGYGLQTSSRFYSRIIEFDPITLDIVWEYEHKNGLPSFPSPGELHRFYSWITCSAQRLPNGNTLTTEGDDGRIFEVTPDNEIVWEYITPPYAPQYRGQYVYRAYRIPPEWVPGNPSGYTNWED